MPTDDRIFSSYALLYIYTSLSYLLARTTVRPQPECVGRTLPRSSLVTYLRLSNPSKITAATSFILVIENVSGGISQRAAGMGLGVHASLERRGWNVILLIDAKVVNAHARAHHVHRGVEPR